jgi:hypothetical protein
MLKGLNFCHFPFLIQYISFQFYLGSKYTAMLFVFAQNDPESLHRLLFCIARFKRLSYNIIVANHCTVNLTTVARENGITIGNVLFSRKNHSDGELRTKLGKIQ